MVVKCQARFKYVSWISQVFLLVHRVFLVHLVIKLKIYNYISSLCILSVEKREFANIFRRIA